MGGGSSSPDPLPPLDVPSGSQLWELGKKENWPQLEALLLPLCSGTFWVTSMAHDVHLASIRAKFDGSRDADDVGILLTLLRTQGDEENADLLKKLLSLGLDPDAEDGRTWERPSHECARSGYLKCAMVLAVCRPKLEVKNAMGKTPIAEADESLYPIPPDNEERKQRMAEIHTFLTEMLRTGFPTLAELASQEKWWAVQNLSRRRLISSKEMFTKHDGKNAVEWAFHHNQQNLAQELLFFLYESCAEMGANTGSSVAWKYDEVKTSVETVEKSLLESREGLLRRIETGWEEIGCGLDNLKSSFAQEKQALRAVERKCDAAQANISALSEQQIEQGSALKTLEREFDAARDTAAVLTEQQSEERRALRALERKFEEAEATVAALSERLVQVEGSLRSCLTLPLSKTARTALLLCLLSVWIYTNYGYVALAVLDFWGAISQIIEAAWEAIYPQAQASKSIQGRRTMG